MAQLTTISKFKFNWHAVYRNIKANFKLALVWAVIMIGALIAFPQVDFTIAGQRVRFDGVDFTDLAKLSNKQIPREFQFASSLDFYGGTEYVYIPAKSGGARVSRSTAVSLVKDLQARFKAIGLNDYELYLRDNNNTTEIVARLPYREAELFNFNSYLGLGGDFQFVIYSQAAEATTETEAFPQTQVIDIKRSDIQSISLNFGSETSGNGFVVRFKEDSFPKALINMYSDINTSTDSVVIMQLDGQPVARQTVPVYSNDPGRNLYLTTGLVEDDLAARLLKDILVNNNLATAVEVKSSSAYQGRYDNYRQGIKWGIILAILLLAGQAIIINRAPGLVSALNFLFLVTTSVALFKILQLPLSLASLLGFGLALAIWVFSLGNFLPLLSYNRVSLPALSELNQQLAVRQRLLRNYLLVSTGFLVVVEIIGIPVIHVFALYFALTVLIAWLGYLFVFPVTLNLLRFTSNGN